MNQSARNPLLYPRPPPVNFTTAETRQLLYPSRRNPTVPWDALHGRPVGDIEARVASRRQPRVRVRKDDIRELIKAGAIIGATILALRLYAEIAPPSPW